MKRNNCHGNDMCLDAGIQRFLDIVSCMSSLLFTVRHSQVERFPVPSGPLPLSAGITFDLKSLAVLLVSESLL